MDNRRLDLNINSAEDINDVNLFSKMDVYSKVTLSSNPRSKQKTPVDRGGGKSPTWDFPMTFTVPDLSHNYPPLFLDIQLLSDSILGDRKIGKVLVLIKELYDTASSSKGEGPSGVHFVSYQVLMPSGKPKGVLNFSFEFGEKISAPGKGNEYLYGPPAAFYPMQAGYGYGGHPPPAPAGYGYGYPPPPPGYGYPPPLPGYGYPPEYGYPPPPSMAAPPQQPKKNNFGMRLGAGILGRAIGGCFIGDMISDSSDAHDGAAFG